MRVLFLASFFIILPKLTFAEKSLEERLTRLEEGQKMLIEIMKTLEKRIDDINKRIDDTNKRIDDTNKRIDELRDTMMWLIGIFLAIVLTILGLVFWVIKQYKPVAEPRMDWIEKHTTERISKLEEELKSVSPLKERVEKIEKKIGLTG